MAMTLDGITLPPGLIWEDEFNWTPVVQNVTMTLTGTVLVQEASGLTGRPITLVGSEESCWASRSVVQQLIALMQTADTIMSLTIGITTYSVMWRREDGTPIEVEQLLPVTEPATDALYVIHSLNFMEVAE
jgi:hypothetical protein